MNTRTEPNGPEIPERKRNTDNSQIALMASPTSLELSYTNNPHFEYDQTQLQQLLKRCGIKSGRVHYCTALDKEASIQDIGSLWHHIEKSLYTRLMIPVSWPLLKESRETLKFFHHQSWARHSIILFSDPEPLHRLNSPAGCLLGATLAKTQLVSKCGVFTQSLQELDDKLTNNFSSHTLLALTMGGTIDKDPLVPEPHVGDPIINQLLSSQGLQYQLEIESICKKDSQQIHSNDLETLFDTLNMLNTDQPILITCGTDQMVQIARAVQEAFGEQGRLILFTGAMTPYWMNDPIRYDAPFNIGYALEALTHLKKGIYIAMNGQLFSPGKAKKVSAKNEFVAL